MAKKTTDPDPNRIPKHIAIIMDGNGRWAKRRGLPRIMGHKSGVKTVDRILQASISLKVEILTLYTFSSENWSRPAFEVQSLMNLLQKNLISQRKRLLDNGVQLRISGNITAFPEFVKKELEETIAVTASNRTLILNLALGYSGREEILAACKSIAADVKSGKIQPDAVSEELFSGRLYTAGLPDPDLIIRTSGEYRLSNFLLWQSSYSELYFTKVLWPNFSRRDLVHAIISYQKRERRFGGVTARESKQ